MIESASEGDGNASENNGECELKGDKLKIRIDKLLSNMGFGSRKEIKKNIANCKVNGITPRFDMAVDTDIDEVVYQGARVYYKKFRYYMLNKPRGVVSATKDNRDKTVLDILPSEINRKNLFVAGRLDKDSTGLLLICDDGDFAHDILSPRKHVDKSYIVCVDKPFTDEVSDDFKAGMILNGKQLLAADFERISETSCKVVLRQGLYHQIKRMFAKHGFSVLTLHRVAIGGLSLPSDLMQGEIRELSDEDVLAIKGKL